MNDGEWNPSNWNQQSQMIFKYAVTSSVMGFISKIKINKYLAHSISGSINAAYNWDGKFNMQLLGYFSAGFIGSYAGVALSSVSLGMAIGGASNILAARGANDLKKNDWDWYKIGQKFVGGALSSLTGMQIANVKKAKYLGELTGKGKKEILDLENNKLSKYKYLFGKELQDKFISYAIQSIGTDFAYTKREYFAERNIRDHSRTLLLGGLGGVIQANPGSFAERWIGYALDYSSQTLNQGYNPLTYDKRWEKIGIFSLKSFGFEFL